MSKYYHQKDRHNLVVILIVILWCLSNVTILLPLESTVKIETLSNSNKLPLVDQLQHQIKIIYKFKDEGTTELWKKESKRCFVTWLIIIATVTNWSLTKKRKDMKPICHQILSPTYTFKKAQEKFDTP